MYIDHKFTEFFICFVIGLHILYIRKQRFTYNLTLQCHIYTITNG